MLRRVCPLLFAGMVLAIPARASAQSVPQWYDGHVSLSGGVSIYDRSGTGTMGIYALRADMPVYPNLLVEAGLSYARRGHDPRFGDLFIPGIQAQLQGLSERFNPYVGMGAGVTVERRDGAVEDDVSFAPSFSAGVRIAIADGVGFRMEGRLHGVGANFRGVYSEMTGGLSVSW
ncbi:MAG: outer membrane beta-barrel protein [Gemmatimonadales bacterium]